MMESCKVETWYTYGQWADVSCLPESVDSSGAMKAVKLKLGTHMDSGLMYRVYQNQCQWPITQRYIPQKVLQFCH